MLVPLQLPQVLPGDQICVVRAVHASAGSALDIGESVIDFSVDLSAGQAFDCAPIAHYRLALAEPGRLKSIDVTEGQEIALDTVIGMLDVEEGRSDGGRARAAQVNVASILHHDDWWDDL
jgi:hypothetical protein